MYKVLAFLIALFVFHPTTKAQVWDTPPAAFSTYTEQDATRLDLIFQMVQYNNMRHFQDNIPLMNEAEAIVQKLQSPLAQAQLQINKSEQFILQGNYKEALEVLLPAFDLLEKHPNPKNRTHACILLSEIDRENSDWEKSWNDLTVQIQRYQDSGDAFGLGWLHLTVANVYLNYIHKDYELFLKTPYHLDQAFEYFDQAGSKTGQGLVLAKYSRFYKNSSFRKGITTSNQQIDHRKAVDYADQSLEIFYEYEQAQNIGYSLYQKATSYSIVGNHEASVPVYQEAVQYYQQDGNLIWLKRLYQHLFVAYSILGNQEQALAENKKYIMIKDSIFSIEKRVLLAEAETKFNTQRIQAEKEQAELKSARNRNYLIGLGIIFSLAALATIFFYGRLRAQKKASLVTLELQETQKRLALEKQYRDSELKALKAQMNPHFIFNALNSIQEYIILNKKNLASDYLGKFADLMRKYLNHSDAGYITIQEEIESLKMYLELEALRFEDSLKYSFEVTPELSDDLIKIPTMLVQPYVENAIKHGLLHKKDNRVLKVSFSKKDSNIVLCVIEDNGVGRERVAEIQKNSIKQRKSFATQATQSRLELLNFNKQAKIGVSIVDLFDDGKAAGTRVEMSIPIKTNL